MPLSNELPHAVAGIAIPDSTIAQEAVDLARRVYSAMLFNHVMRSFFFGKLLAEGEAVDDEVVLLATALHDLGLTDHARGPRRFEIEGADAAHRFLLDRGYAPQQTWLVWDTIALHPWDMNLHKEPEARVAQLGIMADAAGAGIASLDPEIVAEVLAAFPRHGFGTGFFELLRIEAEDKPQAHIVHPVHMVAHHCCYSVPIPDAGAILRSAFPETAA